MEWNPWVRGGRRKRASKTAIPPKSGYFTAIISCSVKTVADTHRQAIVTSFLLVSTSAIVFGFVLSSPHVIVH